MVIYSKLHKIKGLFRNYICLQKTTKFDFPGHLTTKDYKTTPENDSNKQNINIVVIVGAVISEICPTFGENIIQKYADMGNVICNRLTINRFVL